jgi:hypothetical protein
MNMSIINDYEIERYVLDELPGKKARKIKKYLKTDERLREKIEEIKKSNREILIQYPPDGVVPKILHRYNILSTSNKKENTKLLPSFLKRILYASPAFALALVIIFILFPFSKRDINLPNNPTGKDEILVKGMETIDLSKTQLLIHRKQGDHIELLKNGTWGKAGDLLQLAYIAGKKAYGVILSIDGNGNVTLHFPDIKSNPTSLKRDNKILLPNAIELDNAPGFERFFFITSDIKINTADVLKKARDLAQNPDRAKKANLNLPQSFNQHSMIIIKGDQT